MKQLSTKEWIAVVAGIVVIALFVTGLYKVFSPSLDVVSEQTNMPSEQTNPLDTTSQNGAQAKVAAPQIPTPEPDQVIAQDIKVGTGPEAKAGDTVSVHYVGMFTDGKKFDSSLDRGTPFAFTLGAGQVIKGWDAGVAGMKVGGQRLLVIPPQLGYGTSDVGPIPANSVLVFQVELLSIQGN